jgi:hypothetical protein
MMSVVPSQSIGSEAAVPHVGGPAIARVMLACGIAAFLLYISMDALAAALYAGYSYRDQTVSELSAIGAPTRSMWVPLGALYGVLMLAFAYGLWLVRGDSRVRLIIAASVLLMAIMDLVAWPLAPMHQRKVLADGGGTFSDTLHLILGGANLVLFLVVMSVGAAALGRRFRLYSFATIALMLVSGTAMGFITPGLDNNEATPWLGIYERIAVFGPMLWLAVLAAGLLRDVARSGLPRSST